METNSYIVHDAGRKSGWVIFTYRTSTVLMMTRVMLMTVRRSARVAAWVLLTACAGGLPEPTSADLALARADDASVGLDDLQRGRAAYAHRCGNCHALRTPAEREPAAWRSEVARMERVHAVRLTPQEEQDIVRYLRAASAVAHQENRGL
jgi:hypothetical protein